MSELQNTKLYSLVSLIDDDTEEVREEITKALRQYGLGLEQDLQSVAGLIDDDKKQFLHPFILENRKQWIKLNWSKISTIEDEFLHLERALQILSVFDYGIGFDFQLIPKIKELAYEFLKVYPDGTVLDLANFLFVYKEFSGCQDDYYNPLNSNIIYVLENKTGLPITLSLIYMFTAKELGFKVEGCRFPGHFLTKAYMGDKFILVDPFNKGKLIFDKELRYLASESYEPFLDIVNEKTTVKMIIIRILSNLYKAYESKEDHINKHFFEELVFLI